MPNRTTSALLNDIGTEELSHLEMVSTIVHQLTRDLSMEEIEKSGFGPYYIDHTVGVWPQAAGGVPFNACEFQSKGDPITDHVLLCKSCNSEIIRIVCKAWNYQCFLVRNIISSSLSMHLAA